MPRSYDCRNRGESWGQESWGPPEHRSSQRSGLSVRDTPSPPLAAHADRPVSPDSPRYNLLMAPTQVLGQLADGEGLAQSLTQEALNWGHYFCCSWYCCFLSQEVTSKHLNTNTIRSSLTASESWTEYKREWKGPLPQAKFCVLLLSCKLLELYP